MVPSARKFFGIFALLIFLMVYVVATTMLASAIIPTGAKLIEIAYYITAGFLWIIPAGAIISWMQKPAR